MADSILLGTACRIDGYLACWCGESEWAVCFRTSRFGLVRCTVCGCYRTDPPPFKSEEASEGFYTEYYSRVGADSQAVDPAKARTSWFWKVAEQVPQLTAIRSSSADIGSGEGHLCAELRAAGWPHAIGVEISRTRIARARRFYPGIPFYNCLLSQTGIPEGSLDLAVMDSVIEHLPNPVGMLREIRRYLKPGGHLVILTPNMESGHFRFLGRRWTGMLAPHAHIFLFTSTVLSRLLLRCGFLVQAYGSLHAPPYTPGQYLRRLLSGDIRGTLWRAHQEIGGFYGRLINAGSMLYAVASHQQ